jgi:DNA-binding response OmpR family regulator
MHITSSAGVGRKLPFGDAAPGAPAAERVLVVDDNDMIRELVRRVLAGAGFAVDAVASADEARRLAPGGYHVLVVDVRLGAERGTDLVEVLRALDPQLPRRCLLLTGGLDETLPDDVAVLVKPFSVDDLVAAVRSLHTPTTAEQPT